MRRWIYQLRGQESRVRKNHADRREVRKASLNAENQRRPSPLVALLLRATDTRHTNWEQLLAETTRRRNGIVRRFDSIDSIDEAKNEMGRRLGLVNSIERLVNPTRFFPGGVEESLDWTFLFFFFSFFFRGYVKLHVDLWNFQEQKTN